jgi:hypothetical protein
MQTRSKYTLGLINILVIIITMSATMAHSICDMSASGVPASGEQISQTSPAEIPASTDHKTMPCHQQDSGTATSSDSSANNNSLNQCCSDCSVISLPMDAEKTIAPQHSNLVTGLLSMAISHGIELLFRPPITVLR